MSADLASLIRLRYPRLLERGNPLYDAVLAAAVEDCEWHPGDIPGTGVRGWKTSCGESMYPKHRWRIGEDGLNFCPNCGKRAVQVTDDEWAARSTPSTEATP